MVGGKSPATERLVEELFARGVPAQTILEQGLVVGMTIVGRKFQECDFFVPEVLVAARAMEGGFKRLESLAVSHPLEFIGKAVIGTVKGDLHDIGKNIVAKMLQGHGIEVVDLGVDVPPEKFLLAAAEPGVKLLCMSALLTTTMAQMQAVMAGLAQHPELDHVKVLVGGAPVTSSFVNEIGADSCGDDATTGAEQAVRLITSPEPPVRVRRAAATRAAAQEPGPPSLGEVSASTRAEADSPAPPQSATVPAAFKNWEESGEDSRAVLDLALENIAVLDTDLRLRYANHVAQGEIRRLAGGKVAWKGQKCHEVYCSTAVPCVHCPAQEALTLARRHPDQASKVRVHRVLSLCHPVLGSMSLDVSATPVLDEQGTPRMIVVTRRDETLRVSLAKMATAFETIADEAKLVGSIVASGIEAGAYEAQVWRRQRERKGVLSQVAHAILDHGQRKDQPAEEEVHVHKDHLNVFADGRYWWTCGPDAHIERYPDLRDFIAGRAEGILDSPLAPHVAPRPRGVAIHFPLRVWGELWGVVVVSFDLSQRILTTGQLETFTTFADFVQHQVERFLAEKRRLDQLQAVLHNARKPVNAAINLAELLKTDLPVDERDRVIATMVGSLTLASAKLQSLATVWHTLQDRPTHARTIGCNLAELAQATLDMYAPQAEGEGVQLSLDCPTRPAIAYTDPDIFQQILMELIDNSLRWFPRGTRGKRVVVEVFSPGMEKDAWQVSVHDNGSGFTEYAREHAFEVKPSTGRSSGLGLPGVAMFAKALGAKVEILDKPRFTSGASIRIFLPPGERSAQGPDR